MTHTESTPELALALEILDDMNRCPACTEKRLHDTTDWSFHPWAGHGFQNGQGWSHPDLANKPDADRA